MKKKCFYKQKILYVEFFSFTGSDNKENMASKQRVDITSEQLLCNKEEKVSECETSHKPSKQHMVFKYGELGETSSLNSNAIQNILTDSTSSTNNNKSKNSKQTHLINKENIENANIISDTSKRTVSDIKVSSQNEQVACITNELPLAQKLLDVDEEISVNENDSHWNITENTEIHDKQANSNVFEQKSVTGKQEQICSSLLISPYKISSQNNTMKNMSDRSNAEHLMEADNNHGVVSPQVKLDNYKSRQIAESCTEPMFKCSGDEKQDDGFNSM